MIERIRPKDLLTVPNAISALGLGLVIDGSLDIETVPGVTKIAAGRGLDLVDGAMARLLNQTSDTGAAIDAVGDKVGLAAILGSAWYREAVPRPILATLAIRHSLNAAFTNIATFRHPEASFRPTPAGKVSMAADNIALFGYLYANAMEHEDYHTHAVDTMRTIGRAAFVSGIVTGIPATLAYGRRALN